MIVDRRKMREEIADLLAKFDTSPAPFPLPDLKMLPAGAPLSDWLTWLETLHPEEIELGLERVQEVLERLCPAATKACVPVAGTNGKGSCVAMPEALLRAADCASAYIPRRISSTTTNVSS